MKNLITILISAFIITNTLLPRQAIAQSPEKMKYQAVIRNSNGQVITDQSVGMKISILQGSPTGTAVYVETQIPTSNANGLIATEIGTGTVVSGDFTSIDWANGPYFMKIETDPTGGTNYTITGTNQLLSVPYALHAKTADNLTDIDSFSWSTSGNAGTDPNTNFIGTTDNKALLFKVNNLGAGEINPAKSNTFFGLQAGNSNTSGVVNTATGKEALFNNTTGNHNTATGNKALYNNNSGHYNTATGSTALNSNTTGYSNTSNGFRTLYSNTTGYKNTAIGVDALYSNTTGIYNNATGYKSLYSNTTGSVNVANGNETLFSNTTGSQNTAIGHTSLYSNTEGIYNTAIGHHSMYDNTTGEGNTAVGRSSLGLNISGDDNIAIGHVSLWHNTTAYENTSVGNFSLYYTSDGGRNVAIGYEAGIHNISGFYNTAVGWGSGPATSNIKNSTAIGRGASTTAWNQIRIGNNIVTSIGGYVSWSNISDKRFKKEIQQDIVGLDFIMALQPVSYQLDMEKLEQSTGNNRNSSDTSYRETEAEREFNLQSKIEKGSIRQSGFIAQDVEQAAASVGYDFSGVDKPKNENDYYGLRYAEFVVPLVKAIQEQQQIIEQQNKNYENLLKRMEQLEQPLINK
jgi:hypothetical protein